MAGVPELGERFGEDGAALMRSRPGAQEHEVPARHAAESAERARPEEAVMHLDAEALGYLRKLREDRGRVQAGVHAEKDIPALGARPDIVCFARSRGRGMSVAL
jgi:hypothetical protein